METSGMSNEEVRLRQAEVRDTSGGPKIPRAGFAGAGSRSASWRRAPNRSAPVPTIAQRCRG